MPGPMSDSYDPEFGTAYNAGLITQALDDVYNHVADILDNLPPMPILDLIETPAVNFRPQEITATLTTKKWRLIRFALERARDSI